jgi:succinate dehydrogenase / fumarate reductase flavoprotein subunit
VVLATGGVGRAFSITSNSWEYTGDGHALAYEAGADLLDMEFVQFHPTGMVWPPSVRGILVTEGVRGEGACCATARAAASCSTTSPPTTRARPPTLRGGVALLSGRQGGAPPARAPHPRSRRALHRARGARGRGSPHGGVFLDISWIKEKIPHAAEHIKKKLPSMYHQFHQLAGIDITKEPMEVGPTTHYMMGGVRVHPETQMSTVDGLFAAGECGAGLHGANRLGGNSLSDLLVFGKRAGDHAAALARERGGATPDPAQVADAERRALAPFDGGARRRREAPTRSSTTSSA